MKDFQYLDYHTEYSCKGDFEKQMKREYCFSLAFNKTNRDSVSEEYIIILYKGIEFCKKTHNSNACLFTKQQIRNHLKQAQEIYPFKYRVTEISNWKNRGTVFRVHLTLKDVPGTFHKYILTWLRYMYEYPYNVLLCDAYKLKTEKCFRYSSISNLFNLVLGSYCRNPRSIHQITENNISKKMSKKELQVKLKNVRELNDIYLKLGDKKSTIPGEALGKTISDIEYWKNNEIFNTYRKPVYMKVYKETLR
jgi:hypothetical protein